MKFIQTKSVILAICLVYGMLSCKEEVLLPDLGGSLVGFVITFDEFANPYDDHSGVLVSAFGLEGTARTFTDVNGRFEFRDLPAGTYEMHMEKTGFGTMKQFGIKHLGGEPTTLGLRFSGSANSTAVFIYQLPSTEITDLAIQNDTVYGEFVFDGEQPEYVPLRLYLSGIPGFTAAEAGKMITRTLYFHNGRYKSPLWIDDLPFHPGETIYFRACVFANRNGIFFFNRLLVGIDSYFDYDTYQIVYPNLGDESEEFFFVLTK